MFSYEACNLNIISQIEIPVFPKIESSKSPDIEILIKDHFDHSSLLDKEKIIFTNNSVYYENESGTIFEISDDSKIIIYPNKDNNKRNIWDSLYVVE